MKTHTMRIVGVLLMLALLATSLATSALAQGTSPNIPLLSRVKVAHFAPFADTLEGTSVTVKVDGAILVSDFQYGDVIFDYVELDAGDHLIEIIPTGTTTPAISETVTLDPGADYTISAIGNGTLQPLELLQLLDDNEPLSGLAKFRIAHVAPFADLEADTLVDICTDSGEIFNGLTNVPYKGFTDPYMILTPGDYDLMVAAPDGTCSTVYLDLPSLAFVTGQIADLFVIGDIENQDLDHATVTGLLYTKMAYVKIGHFSQFADSVEGSSVSVRIDGEEILTDFVLKDVAGYLDLPSDNHLIEVIPTGATDPVISETVYLAPFTYYTIGVIGNIVRQPVELLVLEDEVDPAPSGAKLRIVHAAPISAVLAETAVDICTEDNQIFQGLSNVLYKQFTDPYLVLPAGDVDLKVAAPDGTCQNMLFDLPSFRLPEGGIDDLWILEGDWGSTTDIDLTPASYVKIAHYAPFAGTVEGTSVTVRVNGVDVLTDFLFKDVVGYLKLDPGDYLIEIIPTGATDPAISGTVTLEDQKYYTAAAIGNGTKQPLELFVLEDEVIPEVGSSKLRIVHAAPFAELLPDTAVDICTEDNLIFQGLSGVLYKQFTDPYLILTPGDYDLKVAAPDGTCSTMLLDLPSFRLPVDGIDDLWIIGDNINLPLDWGSTTDIELTPKETYLSVGHFAPFANTIPGTSVTVRVDGADVLTDFVFGDLTDYLSLEPGDYFIEVLPTGTSTVAMSGTFTLEEDMYYTIAAIGNGTLQPLELYQLVDDVSPPRSGAKLRVVHVAPFASGVDPTRVDICTADEVLIPELMNVPYKGFTDPYLGLSTGLYGWMVTTAGSNCQDFLFYLPSFALTEQWVGTLWVYGDLVNLPPGGIIFPPGAEPYTLYMPIIQPPAPTFPPPGSK